MDESEIQEEREVKLLNDLDESMMQSQMPKVMEITKCPHTQRKHYAKVTY